LTRSVRLKAILWVSVWGVFGTLGLHWYVINRELAETTVFSGYRHSPNYDLRPEGSKVDCVVLHASTQHTLDATIRVFQYPSSLVSSHFIVGKEGRVFQTVPLERRAWHAGASQLDGVTTVNNFSIGIEMVNLNDGTDPYPDLQYDAVARLILQLRQYYQIPDTRIVSHAQIALPAGRKTDPVGFDFDRLRGMLNSFSAATLP
jgi:N-acetyl-anhydromuramyl-L-alanine amidase AmpD